HRDVAIAYGHVAIAHGDHAPAHGDHAPAHGDVAIAYGDVAIAYGDVAIAYGDVAIAYGDVATVAEALAAAKTAALAVAGKCPGRRDPVSEHAVQEVRGRWVRIENVPGKRAFPTTCTSRRTLWASPAGRGAEPCEAPRTVGCRPLFGWAVPV